MVVARTRRGCTDCRLATFKKQVLLRMSHRLGKRSPKNVYVRTASRINLRQVKLSGIPVREKHSSAECLAKPNRSFFDIKHRANCAAVKVVPTMLRSCEISPLWNVGMMELRRRLELCDQLILRAKSIFTCCAKTLQRTETGADPGFCKGGRGQYNKYKC